MAHSIAVNRAWKYAYAWSELITSFIVFLPEQSSMINFREISAIPRVSLTDHGVLIVVTRTCHLALATVFSALEASSFLKSASR